MQQIWDKIKDFAFPLIAGLIIFPVKSIFGFNGIIYRHPELTKNQKIRVPFSYRSSESLKNTVIILNLSDTTTVIHKPAGIFVDRIPSDQSFKTSGEVFYLNDPTARAIQVPEIDEGEYELISPVTVKNMASLKTLSLDKTVILQFRIKEDKSDDLKVVKTRPYRFYFFVFFHPWLTSGILFVLAIIIQLAIKKLKPKK